MKKTVRGIVSIFVGVGALVVTHAQQTTVEQGFGTLSGIINSFSSSVVGALASLFMAAAVVIFFMGIVQYVWGVREGKADQVKNGNQFMIWGLVALFVMFSVYGIIKFGQNIFFKGEKLDEIVVPTIKINGSSGGSGSPQPSGSCVPTNSCTTPGSPVSNNGRCNASGVCVLP